MAKVNSGTPWDRYALIAALADKQAQTNNYLGKTALQKQIYFLQTVFGVDVGYDFSLYSYGPFSSELHADLDAVQAIGAVNVSYDDSIGGYRIKPGTDTSWLREKAATFLADAEPAIDALIKEFGKLYARQLELRATIVYSDRELAENSESTADIEKVVSDLKPRFAHDEIRSAVKELEAAGRLRARA